MIPDRPIPPDHPDHQDLPSPHRMTMETLRKESAETNLWDLDEDIPLPRNPVTPKPRSVSDAAPPEEEQAPFAEIAPGDPAPAAAVTRSTIREPSGPRWISGFSDPSPGSDDMAELDPVDLSPATAGPPAPESTLPSATPESAPEENVVPITEAASPRKPIFSRQEAVSIGVVALLLLVCAGYFMFNAFRDLPRSVDPHAMPDMPIKGGHLVITAAETYWREPVTTGPDAEVVQRGARLIPVIEIHANSGDSTLRIQFRNSEGTLVGDPVTRAVNGRVHLTVPSTSGFDELHIHNAYRAGLVDPWTVEVLEAPANTTAGSAFRLLSTFPIASDRR